MSDDWKPTHLHVKSGRSYRELYRGLLEFDLSPVVIYQGVDSLVWVRPAREFDDGRFLDLRV